jgi:hypothetical protein
MKRAREVFTVAGIPLGGVTKLQQSLAAGAFKNLRRMRDYSD